MKLLLTAIISFLSITSFSQQFDFFGPEPFDQILDNSFQKNWSPSTIQDFSNLSYVLLMDQSKSNVILINNELSEVSSQPIDFSNTTYEEVLRSTFQLVDINTHLDNSQTSLAGEYQLKPFLHSFFALNSSNNQELTVTDAGTMQISETTTSGYLLMEFSGTPNNAQIKAISQWEYTNGGFEQSQNWTESWLSYGDNGNLLWTTDQSAAGSFYMADAHELFNLEIPDGSNFNPNSTSYQPNATAEIPEDATDITESKIVIDLESKLDASYIDQLGDSPAADNATNAALDAIETTLQEAGLSMRYPKDFYIAARKAMLNQVIASSEIYGARLGYRTTPNVYFTNESDDSGEPHPFMVITSHAVSARPNQLIDVDRPPGAEQGVGYAESTVTRNGKLGEFLIKIPIRDYGLIDELTDNDLSAFGDLASDFDSKQGTNTEWSVYNYTSLVSNGVAIDGVTIYPAQNNNLRFAVEDAEVTHSGIHVGGGLELHYHADGHAYNGNGINLYNLQDYESKDHPPVIGFAHDGIALFGRYEPNYPMTGNDLALDEYGGHDHGDGFGYHYHAHDEQHTADMTGKEFTEHFLLVGAWKGQINDIPGFLELKTNQLEDPTIAKYAGGISDSHSGGGEPHNILGLNERLNIYPNPSTKYIHINVTNAAVIIYNMDGQIVLKSKISEPTDLPVGHIAKGNYILSIEDRTGVRKKHIIIN